MKKLAVYLKGYYKETVCAPLFKLLEALFELFVPLVMAAIIDTGIATRDTGYIVQMCLLLILLGIIGLVCSITAQYFAAKAATGFSTALRHSLFEHIQKLGYAEMDVSGSSTLITRMTSDINQVQSGINLVLRLFMRSPFIVFGAMVMAFTVDVQAAWVFVIVIPLLAVVVFSILLGTMPLYRKVQAGLDRILLDTRENLTGVRVIRAFNKEKEERERFESDNQHLTDAQKLAGKISGLMNPLTYIIVDGGIIALLYIGAIRVDFGLLSQGQVVALVNYMSQILVELVKLANLIITVSKSVACAHRIRDVLEIQPHQEDGTQALMPLRDVPVVAFDRVSMAYPAAKAPSLEDVSFTAYAGQTIGIIGGTGSGKSSLVNLIPRFYDAQNGEVRLWGVNVQQLQREELRKKIGVVPQKAVLFKGTIAENLRWGSESASDEDLKEALEISQALEFVEKKEEGLDFEIEQDGMNLSGGQKQRLTIARALVRKPEILILDDSASALDYATDAKLRHAIGQRTGKMTVFIVSQRAASVLHADQILVLDDGKVVGQGTHEQLLNDCAVYQEIYYSQFPKEVHHHAF